MGEKSDAKLMFSMDGKSFQDVPEINELSMEVQEDDRQPLTYTLKGGEMTFSCKISPLTLLGIFMGQATLIRYCQSIKSNNWLKLHGLPMRRSGI